MASGIWAEVRFVMSRSGSKKLSYNRSCSHFSLSIHPAPPSFPQSPFLSPSLFVCLTRCRDFSRRLQGYEASGQSKANRRKESGYLNNCGAQHPFPNSDPHWMMIWVRIKCLFVNPPRGGVYCSCQHYLLWLIQRPWIMCQSLEPWLLSLLTESRTRKWVLQSCIWEYISTCVHWITKQFMKHFP